MIRKECLPIEWIIDVTWRHVKIWVNFQYWQNLSPFYSNGELFWTLTTIKADFKQIYAFCCISLGGAPTSKLTLCACLYVRDCVRMSRVFWMSREDSHMVVGSLDVVN